MRVLVIDESPERAVILREGLESAGCEVVASLPNALDLLKQVESVGPDLIIIDTDSPSRDVIEHLCVMSQHQPRPVVMFASDSEANTIRDVMRAGVSAYVVNGLSGARVKPIIDVAVARFAEFQRLKNELADVQLRLDERRLVDRAKGILMKQRDLDEEHAYRTLRSFAMSRNLRLGEAAQRVIDAADLLG